MAYTVHSRSLTISANYFNVSVFRESWLLSENILKPEDVDPTKSFFSPNFIHVENPNFELLIRPPALTIDLKENSNIIFFEIANKIIDKLPHLDYLGLQIETTFLIEDFDETLGKNFFYNSNNSLFKFFSNEEEKPRFGAYLSKEIFNGRLKIQANPALVLQEDEKTKNVFLLVECNLDKEMSREKNHEVSENIISDTKAFYEYSKSLVDSLNEK